jgi:hypothetical protein
LTGSYTRLLRLLPNASGEQEIVCEIVLHNLEDENDLSYEALSYVWGPPPWDTEIMIRQTDEMYVLHVPQNLFSALQALRLQQHSRTLWIDAVCINQTDLEEKSDQVTKMGDIFRMASGVCIWLGEADEYSTMAIDFIQRIILNLQSFDEMYRSQEAKYGWRAVIDLMQRPWFSRRWVIQEVSLSTHADLYCGTKTIPWADFADAVQLFSHAERTITTYSEMMGKDPKAFNFWYEEVSTLGASQLVDITSNLFRRSASHQKPLLSLEYLVSQLSMFDVAEPHDLIYSLLAIANDVAPRRISCGDSFHASELSGDAHMDKLTPRYLKVDYSQPFVEVCKDFVIFSIDQSTVRDPSRALDIICRPWAPISRKPGLVLRNGPKLDRILDRDTLPSWVPDWRGAAYSNFSQINSRTKTSRKNADSLVGLPAISPYNYNAAGGRGVELQSLDFQKYGKSYSMFVSGFVLDYISKVEVASQGGHIPEEWIEAVAWKNMNDNPPEEFWRTLVADRGLEGGNPPTYYPRACKESITKALASGSLDTTKAINERGVPFISSYFRRVQAVIWNRSLMRTHSGRLGIVSKQAREGDMICILYGCSVPVVLRRHPRCKDESVYEKSEPDLSLAERKEAVAIRLQRAFRQRREHRLRMKSTYQPKTCENQEHMKHIKLHSPKSPLSKRMDKKYWYTLIGECYVNGMMDGEAISYQYEHGIEPQIFELR